MSAERNSASGRREGTEQVVNGDPEQCKALGEVDIDGPTLEGKGKMGNNCV